MPVITLLDYFIQQLEHISPGSAAPCCVAIDCVSLHHGDAWRRPKPDLGPRGTRWACWWSVSSPAKRNRVNSVISCPNWSLATGASEYLYIRCIPYTFICSFTILFFPTLPSASAGVCRLTQIPSTITLYINTGLYALENNKTIKWANH